MVASSLDFFGYVDFYFEWHGIKFGIGVEQMRKQDNFSPPVPVIISFVEPDGQIYLFSESHVRRAE